MVNENTGLIGIVADVIGSAKDTLIGAESMLTDVNMLGMTRPLAQINIAEQLRAQGGILPSLQTGAKKARNARKGMGTGAAPTKRYRPTSPPAEPQPRTSQAVDQPEELEIIL